MRTLVVTDMQNDFIDGALGFEGACNIIPEVKRLIDCAQAAHDNIIFTQDTHFPWYYDTQEGHRLPILHCLKGTRGWRIHEDLTAESATYIEKWNFGYDQWDKFYDKLSDTEIVICGLVTSICVLSNALLLKTICPESRIVVVGDATADPNAAAYEAAKTILTANQIRWENHYDYK